MKLRSVFFFACIMLALSACSLADDITPPPGYKSPVPQPTLGALFPANPPDLASGATIFAEKCAPCHGAQGLGDGPQAADLPKKPTALGAPEIARAAIPANWYTIVTQGKIETFMPPFKSLDDQQRWDVVAYAFSLATSSTELAQGKSVYQANCADCHGADGKKSAKSDLSDQARMAKLSLDDLVKVINQGVDAMPAFESQLSIEDRYAAAAYVRTFTFPAAQATVPAGTEVPAATAVATEDGAAVPTVTSDASGSADATAIGSPDETIGVINGKVTNKSGGSLPAGLKVVLHVFEHDPTSGQFSEIGKQETTVSADGAYSFANVSMPSSQAFYVSVDYANTTYDSEPAVPAAGQTVYDLPIDIYDTTTDSSGLLADQLHIILDYSKADVIQVVEFYVISNPGAKTVIPAEKGAALITVTLPTGYTNLQFQDGQLGERYIETTGGFGDTFPIPPGDQKYQLVFAFELPYSPNFDFIEPFSLDVSSVTFMVSEGVKANAPGILDGGLKDMGDGGGKYQLYTVGSYKTGQSLKVSVSGAPGQVVSAAPVTGTDATRNIIIGVGALGLALVLAGGWLFWRERKQRAPDEQILPEEGPNGEEEEINGDETLDAIIALDDQYNAGNITYDAYQQRRAELKEKLKGKL